MIGSGSKITQLFNHSRTLYPYFVLANARQKIKSNYGVNTTELKRLEEELQEIYYPTKESSPKMQQLQEQIRQARGKFIVENAKQVVVSPELRENMKKLGNSKHTNKMAITTYLGRMMQIYEILKRGQRNGGIDTSIIPRAEALLRDMKQALVEAVKSQEGGLFLTNFYAYNENGTLFQQLDEIYNLLFNTEGLSAILGEAFEREALVVDLIRQVGIENLNEETINRIVHGLYSVDKKYLYGKNQTMRNDILQSNVFIITKEQKTTKKNNTSVKYSVSSSSGSVDISGVLAEKMGKVDFIFNEFSTDRPPLFASLKSWGNMDRDFGHTSLLNGMIRGSKLDSALSYGLVVGYYNPQGKLAPAVTGGIVTFNQFAKACLLVDILSGISQGMGHMADTIVINDRENKKIRVYSVINILKNVSADLSLLDKYVVPKDGGSYEEVIQTISLFDANSKKIGAQDYLNTLITQMKQIELKLSAGIIDFQ